MERQDQGRSRPEWDELPGSGVDRLAGTPRIGNTAARVYGGVQRRAVPSRRAAPSRRSAPARQAPRTATPGEEAALLGREPASPEPSSQQVQALRLRIEGPLIEEYRAAVARLDVQALRTHARSISRALQDEQRAVIEGGAAAPDMASALAASQGAFRARVLRAMGPGFGAPVIGLDQEDVKTAVLLAFRQMRDLVTSARIMRDRLDRAGSPEHRREAARLCAREIERRAAQSPAYVLFLHRALQREGLFDRVADAHGANGQSVAYMTVAALDSLGGPPRTVEGIFIQLAKLRESWVSPAPDHAGIAARLDDILVALQRMCDRERFDAMRGQAGFGTQTLSLAFGAADSIRALQRLARLGRGGPGRGGLWDMHVTQLQVAREPLELLAGERPLAGSTIAAIDRASYVSLGAYGALFGGLVAGAALVELAPVLAVEAEFLWTAGRWAYTWALANPVVTTEIAAFLTGLGLEMADAGVTGTLERMSTPEGAAMVLVEILLMRSGAHAEGGPQQQPLRQSSRQPAPGPDAGKLREHLTDVRVRARALKNWARERVEGATAGTTSGGGLSAVPGRSLDEHVQDARQQYLLSQRARGRANGDAQRGRRMADMTDPAREPDPLARPGGPRTKVRDWDDDDTRRGHMRENEAADVLVQNGYDVQQNPAVAGNKKPDYLINGKVFDCYAPKYGTDARRIFGRVQDKVREEQTRRILLNLDDSNVRIPRLMQEFSARRSELRELDEVLAVRKGTVVRIYPVPASKMKKGR